MVDFGGFRICPISTLADSDGFRTQDTSILCVTKLVDFGGFRILSSKNTQGVRVKCLLGTAIYTPFSQDKDTSDGIISQDDGQLLYNNLLI